MVRLCGAVLGLFAFGVTVLLGLRAGNPSDVILVRALYALFAFFGIGLGAGWVAYRVLDEHAVRRHGEMFREIEEEPNASEPQPGTSDPGGAAPGTATDPARAGGAVPVGR
jgi:hypothetical protein